VLVSYTGSLRAATERAGDQRAILTYPDGAATSGLSDIIFGLALGYVMLEAARLRIRRIESRNVCLATSSSWTE
jgi:hypothetical protein